MRYTFPAQRRLRLKTDFEKVRGEGKRIADSFFSMTFRPNDLGSPRLGLAVAVRTAGGAVARNRVRRIVKDSFRLAQHELPAVDFVVAARTRVKDAPARELHLSLGLLWKQVATRCALPSRG
ncbi:MAG TPA: ribonuclease P protein component [Steroidobacteraceae bacterium]|nr:ribonuclease P protein component [Steroidobacteraceae bacterium]HQX79785.1 ribonuclease P protein component [Steroidobacteraceae bacterium]